MSSSSTLSCLFLLIILALSRDGTLAFQMEDIEALVHGGSSNERDVDEPAVTRAPTGTPTSSPVDLPTKSPTDFPTKSPTKSPTVFPTDGPTKSPTDGPTKSPTDGPTKSPTDGPTKAPTKAPTDGPTTPPTKRPSPTPVSNLCDDNGDGSFGEIPSNPNILSFDYEMEISSDTTIDDAVTALGSAIVQLILNSKLGNCDVRRKLTSNLRQSRRLDIVGVSANPTDNHASEKVCRSLTLNAESSICAVMEGKLSLYVTSDETNIMKELLLLISVAMTNGSLADAVDGITQLAYVDRDDTDTMLQDGDEDRDRIGEDSVQPPVSRGLSPLDIGFVSGACALLLVGVFGGRKMLRDRGSSSIEDDNMSESDEVVVEDSMDVSELVNFDQSLMNSSGSVTVSGVF